MLSALESALTKNPGGGGLGVCVGTQFLHVVNAICCGESDTSPRLMPTKTSCPRIARRKLRVAAGRPRRDKHRCVTRTASQSRASWYKVPSRSRRCRFSRGPGGTMALRTILLTGTRILAACLLFAVCFAVGGVLSGLDKIGQRAVASQPASPANQQVPQMPENLLGSFLIFTVCVGGTLSYLILRSRWHGWMLVGAVFVSMYGISTVASQLD